MIKAVIIDDESKGIEILKVLINKYCPEVQLIGWAEEVDEAILLINSLQPNLIFLDIEMTGETGFELLERVKPYSFHVILVTAHSEYAVRAFRYSVADYLLKPVDFDELKEAVKKVGTLLQEDHSVDGNNSGDTRDSKLTLKIPFHQRMIFVKITDIIRVEADGAYTRIYLTDKRKYIVSYNIKVIEMQLDKNLFMRVHRSHIINLRKVSTPIGDGRQARMYDGTIINIARRIRTTFILHIQSIPEVKSD